MSDEPATDSKMNPTTHHAGNLHLWRWPLASVFIVWAIVVGIALVLQNPLEVRLSNAHPIVVTLDDSKGIQVLVQDHQVSVKDEIQVYIKGGHLDAEAQLQ